jgi:predicted Rossmann-fold nucleotide-binding protein
VTLIQTRKVKPFPVILAGEPEYWDGLLAWLRNTVVPRGKLREEELAVLQRAQTPKDVLRILKKQARTPPADRTGRSRAGKEIP